MYRASDEEARFSERQRAWIHATTTEDVVRANLAGKAVGPQLRVPIDRALRWTFRGGLGLLGAGVVAVVSHWLPDLVATFPGLLLLASAAVWRASLAAKGADVTVHVITLVPVFESHGRFDEHGDAMSTKYITHRETRLEWPRALRARDDLGDDEPLRIGIVKRAGTSEVAWAFPVQA